MSTLRPGRVSETIAALRDAALAEADKIPKGVSEVEELSFDKEHDQPPPASDPDVDSWVAKYPGQNSPHIGNGRGGVK